MCPFKVKSRPILRSVRLAVCVRKSGENLNYDHELGRKQPGKKAKENT